MDGHFVPNISFGPAIVAAVRPRAKNLFFDVHLMCSRPEILLEPFANAGADQITTFQLLSAEATAEPIKPPISAWLELEGKPMRHVIRFHRIAPSSPQIRVTPVTQYASTSPWPTVVATAVPASAPHRVVTDARAIAYVGVSTLVPTTAATELAVSWKPLTNSKTSATAMTVSRRVIAAQECFNAMWAMTLPASRQRSMIFSNSS